MICDRPDLLRRVEIGDITINNYYVCEIHFPNQILDYATRKILIKTAKPLSLDELKVMPKMKGKKSELMRHRSIEFDMNEFDDDNGVYEMEDSKGTQTKCKISIKNNIRKKKLCEIFCYRFRSITKMTSNLAISV